MKRARMSWWASTVAVALCGATAVQAGEPGWLQWGGPGRDFRLESASLPTTPWPDSGPERLWSRQLGEGYSAIVTDGEALYTMYRDGGNEVIVALDAATGETRWQHAYAAPLPGSPVFDFWHKSAGPGPYATPLLVGSRLFAAGVAGHLHVLDAATGELLWSRDLVADFAIPGFRGHAASPIAYGDTVILPVGGPGQGLVAFDQATGEVAWKSTDLEPAPASPILTDLAGREQLVVFGQKQIAGVDPADGRLLWSHPHETQYGLNISTPVAAGEDLVFCTSAYDGGSRMLRVSRQADGAKAQELWFTNRVRVHFGNALRVGDMVLGSSGDFGPAFFVAMDVESGEELWRERSFARAHMVYAGGKLVIVDEDGEVAVATPNREGLEVHARATVLKENAWTPPTLVGDRLYVRDRASVVALDLGE